MLHICNAPVRSGLYELLSRCVGGRGAPRICPSRAASSRAHALAPFPPCSLALVFGKNFSKALEIVDKGGVLCHEGDKSGRRVCQVRQAQHRLGTSTAEQGPPF